MSQNGHSLITGGCGFVGTNLAHRLLREGQTVSLLDNLSRPGASSNLEWLQAEHGARVNVIVSDVRDARTVRRAVRFADRVFHLAGQVAVTRSLIDPRTDFDVNTRGTMNVLEAVRESPRTQLVFASTNKVYGALENVRFSKRRRRYAPTSAQIAAGIDERRPLDFHSPYGCSKGAADQYVRDYARCYGISAVVFRMSCIYGPHQFGNEDQGWVAHFLLSALDRRPITIYGDGKQVRDVLFVDDLVEAFLLASAHMDRISGKAFNIGGGPANALSLRDLLAVIQRMLREKPVVHRETARIGDQKFYVSDTSRFERATGWRPRVSARDGIAQLQRWFVDNGVHSLGVPAPLDPSSLSCSHGGREAAPPITPHREGGTARLRPITRNYRFTFEIHEWTAGSLRRF